MNNLKVCFVYHLKHVDTNASIRNLPLFLRQINDITNYALLIGFDPEVGQSVISNKINHIQCNSSRELRVSGYTFLSQNVILDIRR